MIAGRLGRLLVSDTRFEPGRGGAVLISSARTTEIARSAFALPVSPRGAPVQIAGGLLMSDSMIDAGSIPGGGRAAVLVLPADGSDLPLELQRNQLEKGGVLLMNWSARTPRLEGNRLPPGAIETSTSGAWFHRIGGKARELYSSLRHLAGVLQYRLLTPAGQ
ncbi:MAG: hypothetical protein JOZ17_22255 [Acetobacteraceae bacterium]|nr:hypothetical protein [Acetobacteraceae bacterium]